MDEYNHNINYLITFRYEITNWHLQNNKLCKYLYESNFDTATRIVSIFNEFGLIPVIYQPFVWVNIDYLKKLGNAIIIDRQNLYYNRLLVKINYLECGLRLVNINGYDKKFNAINEIEEYIYEMFPVYLHVFIARWLYTSARYVIAIDRNGKIL